MHPCELTDGLSVTGQLSTDDIEAVKDAGFTTVICNRPDGETADQLWMLANPHDLGIDERIERAAAAGYDLAALRPSL